MKVAISGMNGFIGQNLKKYLEDRGDQVFGIETPLLHFLNDYNLKGFLKSINPDFIVHLAAYGNHYNQTGQRSIYDANVLCTLNLLNASKDIDYSMFYNISSSSVLLPVKTEYAKSKIIAENIAKGFAQAYDKPIINVRPYSVFGEGEADWRFIPTVIMCLLTDETMKLDENATHDWIYVQSFIENMLDNQIEIGTGYKYTNLEVVKILEVISGKKLNYEPVENLRNYDWRYWVCNYKLPHLRLYDALERTYRYYKERYEK